MSTEKKKKSVIDILLIVFSFIPFLNTFTLLHFGGRIKDKRFTRNGWIILFVNILLIVVFFLTFSLEYVDVAQLPYDKEPNVYDYVDRQAYDNATYAEREALPGYYEYKDAYDKWKSSEEYVAAYNANRSFRSAMEGLRYGVAIAINVVNLVIFFYMISKKQYYFDRLDSMPDKNRAEVYERLKDAVPTQNGTDRQSAVPAPPSQQPAHSPEPEIKTVDVNLATEEEIGALPGLTIIDGKRAVEYRNENGPFRSPDDFFEAIRVKPHVMVKLQDYVTASAPAAASEQEGKGSRVIDL